MREKLIQLGTNHNEKDNDVLNDLNGPRIAKISQTDRKPLTVLEHILQPILYMYGAFTYIWLILIVTYSGKVP